MENEIKETVQDNQDQVAAPAPETPAPQTQSTEDWQTKYKNLQRELSKKDREINDYKRKQGDMETLRAELSQVRDAVLGIYDIAETTDETSDTEPAPPRVSRSEQVRQRLMAQDNELRVRRAQSTFGEIQQLVAEAGMQMNDPRLYGAQQLFTTGRVDEALQSVRFLTQGIAQGGGGDVSASRGAKPVPPQNEDMESIIEKKAQEKANKKLADMGLLQVDTGGASAGAESELAKVTRLYVEDPQKYEKQFIEARKRAGQPLR